MATFSYTCIHCGVKFETHKEGKKHCKQACYFAAKKRFVTKICEVCHIEFTIAYRFREQKTCGRACGHVLLSRAIKTREVKNCLTCEDPFEVVQSYKDKAKYCSCDCYLAQCDTRQPDVKKTCEYCEKDFIVPFTKNHRRFCSKSCAQSGENNPFFGATGEAHPMHGKKAWNNGLTTETDDRVKALGEKISALAKEQFQSGERSNAGEKNPNFGNTADTLSDEKRENYSKAAIQRVIDGVSGYKTGHLTGVYYAKKTSNPVKFKSSWELAAMMIWDRDKSIARYEYEPQIVRYENRRALPDFLLTLTDGTREFIEIKPTAIQNIPEVHDRLLKIKKVVNESGYDYRLMGDEIIKPMIKLLGKDFENEVKRHQSGQ